MTMSNWWGWPFISTEQLLLPYKHFLAYGTRFGTSPKSQSIPAAVEHLHLQHLKYLVPVHHWDLAMLWKRWDFLATSKGVDGLCQPNSASDPKLFEKLLTWRTDSPSERRSVLYAPFPLISLLHNLVSPVFCAKRRFHSLSTTHPECLMLSLMSLVEEWTWTCCHDVCSERAATSLCCLLPQMQTEAFNLSVSSQHRHFSDFKRTQTA